MDLFTQLFGNLLVFVYHCFDRIVIYGSRSTGSHNPYCGTLMPLGPSTPSPHDEFGQSRAAVAAAPFHLHQRHVAAASDNQRGEIGVLRVAARLAPRMHAKAYTGHRAGSMICPDFDLSRLTITPRGRRRQQL
jgi:hypothetical protein